LRKTVVPSAVAYDRFGAEYRVYQAFGKRSYLRNLSRGGDSNLRKWQANLELHPLGSRT